MNIVDFIIWGTAVILFIILIYRIYRFILLIKEVPEKNESKKSHLGTVPDNVCQFSRLNMQVRGSVRLFHSNFITKDDLIQMEKEVKNLP